MKWNLNLVKMSHRRSWTSRYILTWYHISNKSKALWNIWALIGYMIDTFRNTIIDVCRRVVRKSRNETRTYHSVWYSTIYVNQGFLESLFCGPMLKRLTQQTTPKMNILCVLKNVICKNFELSKWPIFVNKTSKQLQFF